ncbi:MAG: phenylalanine--tRNA ligase subunit beta [Puniceicoccaceae bacterium]|nr:MAG: phenylalanine--tRNA ligase subunit beta [Puniceicoccaceae bacterium]
MKVSLSWLKNYVELDRSLEEIERAFVLLGFEVEGVEFQGLAPLDHVVVGEILASEVHPNADRLSVCRVITAPGGEPRRIVCGAKNYRVGDRVPVALPGAELPGGFKIKASKLRGVQSEGMMCSARELGLGEDGEGLLILDPGAELGRPLNDLFPGGDWIFDLEITPNRSDCLSHVGLARELAAHFGGTLIYPELRRDPGAEEPSRQRLLAAVEVESGEDCPLYMAHVIAGVKVGPSPDWLQQALKSIGLRPINNVVDATNYVLHELGQPLHAFDAKKLKGGKIIVRHAREGESITTLDEKERTLNGRMLVIADAERPVAIAGIMGGADSEVDESTTDIVLESAYFRPGAIRWTSRRLGISTDSSYRYERGVDSQSLAFAAMRALDLILETAGGRVCSPSFKVGGEQAWVNEITLGPDFIREQIGFEVEDDVIRQCLESLELSIEHESTDEATGRVQWTVRIPGFRGDLDRPIDLVEEFLRIYGTDRIPEAPVRSIGIVAKDDPVAVFQRTAAEHLAANGFLECYNYTLRSGPELKRWLSHSLAEELALANPLNEDQSHLRHSLIPGLLDGLKLNHDRGTGASRLFEVGRTFHEAEGRVFEMVTVGFVIDSPAPGGSWRDLPEPDFFTVKQLLHDLVRLAGLRLDDLVFQPVGPGHPSWQEGHAGLIEALPQGYRIRGGLMNLARLREFDLKRKVHAGQFSILPERLREKTVRPGYRAVSVFPPAIRDLALVVPQGELAGEVRRHLAEAGRQALREAGFVLESIELFDVFTGGNLPEGTKSLAFSLVFRSAEGTLQDDAVNAVFSRIQKLVTETTPYRIRN